MATKYEGTAITEKRVSNNSLLFRIAAKKIVEKITIQKYEVTQVAEKKVVNDAFTLRLMVKLNGETSDASVFEKAFVRGRKADSDTARSSQEVSVPKAAQSIKDSAGIKLRNSKRKNANWEMSAQEKTRMRYKVCALWHKGTSKEDIMRMHNLTSTEFNNCKRYYIIKEYHEALIASL